MDSSQENNVLKELINFEKNPDEVEEIPEILEKYLNNVARSGDIVHKWENLRPFLKKKIEIIATEFNETYPFDRETNQPNVKPFDFDEVKRNILNGIDSFTGAPFTIQRICELLTDPYRHYKRADKFLKGLEKNVMVISEEGDEHRPENGNTSSSISSLNSTFTLPSTSTSDSINQQQTSAFHNGYKENENDFLHSNNNLHQTTSTIQQLDSFTTVFVTSQSTSSPLEKMANLPILDNNNSNSTVTTNNSTNTNSCLTSSPSLQTQSNNNTSIIDSIASTTVIPQLDNNSTNHEIEQQQKQTTTLSEIPTEQEPEIPLVDQQIATSLQQDITQLTTDNVIVEQKPVSLTTNLEEKEEQNSVKEEEVIPDKQQQDEIKPDELVIESSNTWKVPESTVEIVQQEESEQMTTTIEKASIDVKNDELSAQNVLEKLRQILNNNQINELKRRVSEDDSDNEQVKRFKSNEETTEQSVDTVEQTKDSETVSEIEMKQPEQKQDSSSEEMNVTQEEESEQQSIESNTTKEIKSELMNEEIQKPSQEDTPIESLNEQPTIVSNNELEENKNDTLKS